MSSLGYKKLESSKSSSSDSNDIGEININILNNDCLIRIFEELSFEDRLKVEMVCKRWNGVGKLSWSNVKKLTITKRFKNGQEKFSTQTATNFYTNVIKRCGIYLIDVCIRNDLERNNLSVLKMISQECKNLNKFSLIGEFGTRFFVDKHLKMLFEENINLLSVSLKTGWNKLSGQRMDCLLSLRLDKIIDLRLDLNHNNYKKFFPLYTKIINLKKLHLNIQSTEKCNALLVELSNSNYQGLEDLTLLVPFYNDFTFRVPLHLHPKNHLNNLSNFVLKHKKLTKLSINEIDKNEDFLKFWLKLDLIEEIKIRFFDGIPSSITGFKNLTSLKCHVFELTDECIKNLTKCTNLKEIGLSTGKNLLTNEGENNFSKFEKLESFQYFYDIEFRSMKSGPLDKIGPILKSLSSCKNLNDLCINGCNITDVGVNSLCLMRNLISLSISWTNVTNNQVIKIISELKNLNKLCVNGCRFLTHDLVEKLDDVKINRGDENVLKVYIVHDSQFTKKFIQNQEINKKNFKLISLRYYHQINSIFDY